MNRGILFPVFLDSLAIFILFFLLFHPFEHLGGEGGAGGLQLLGFFVHQEVFVSGGMRMGRKGHTQKREKRDEWEEREKGA